MELSYKLDAITLFFQQDLVPLFLGLFYLCLAWSQCLPSSENFLFSSEGLLNGYEVKMKTTNYS